MILSLFFSIHLHLSTVVRGFAKKKKLKKSEITLEVGVWFQVSLGFFLNRPKIALKQC